jgi:hypothetical protein
MRGDRLRAIGLSLQESVVSGRDYLTAPSEHTRTGWPPDSTAAARPSKPAAQSTTAVPRRARPGGWAGVRR